MQVYMILSSLVSLKSSLLGILVRDETAREELRKQVGDIGIVL